jgi:pimeloyl-ACP methyl ester carboxylesterase
MEDRLPLVRCPALLLYGRDDPFASPERAAALRAAFRPAREATIAAGVFAASEAPKHYAEAVLEYLDGPP